jgi:hypothetical protein
LARKPPFDGFEPNGKAMEGAEEWEDPINYDEDIVGPRTRKRSKTQRPSN